jgi:hypothetical protein
MLHCYGWSGHKRAGVPMQQPGIHDSVYQYQSAYHHPHTAALWKGTVCRTASPSYTNELVSKLLNPFVSRPPLPGLAVSSISPRPRSPPQFDLPGRLLVVFPSPLPLSRNTPTANQGAFPGQ